MKRKGTLIVVATLVVAVILVASSGVWLVRGAAHAAGTAQEPATAPGSILQTPAGNAFSYQGYLTDGGSPANGVYDFSFMLYADAAGTQWVANANSADNVSVVNGLFTVQVDLSDPMYGDVYFYLNGDARYLRIGVRPGASTGAYTYLSPLQPLTPAPYALALPGLNTVQNSTSANVIGGYSWNYVDPNVVGAAIGGGGHLGGRNEVYGDYGTVGGGRINRAQQDDSTVGGGASNMANGNAATVGGGEGNTAGGACATVAGGCGNVTNNTSATVGGGDVNYANGQGATVSGGSGNTADGLYAAVPGGNSNYAGGNYSLAAGRRAKAYHQGSFVWADSTNANFDSTATDQFRVRATNGASFITNSSTGGLWVENDNVSGDGIHVIANVTMGTNYATVYAVNNGTSPAVFANSAGTYSGYFLDDIYVQGNCVGCTLAYVALNGGDAPVETGDLVTIGSLEDPLEGTTAPVLQVRLAGAGDAVVGVVQGRATIATSEKEGQVLQSAERVPGAAAPGEYLFVVVSGLAQVKADGNEGAIAAGQRLTAAGRTGHARALRSRMLDGMAVAEGAPVVGIALAPLDSGTGLIPVLVTLR